MNRRVLQLIPSLVLAVLLVLVAQAQTPHRVRWPIPAFANTRATPASAVRPAAHAAPLHPGQLVLSCSDGSVVTPSANYAQPLDSQQMTLLQALPISHTAAEIEVDLLSLSPAGSVTYTVVAVEAETGLQDFSTVPYFSSPPGTDLRRVPLNRPIVVGVIDGIGVPGDVTRTAGLAMQVDDPGFGAVVGYAMEGPVEWPTMTAQLSSGLPADFQGSHPVMGIGVCTATATTMSPPRDLRVVQQVLGVTGPMPIPGLTGFRQDFSVPSTVTAEWVELALQYSSLEPSTVTPSPIAVSIRMESADPQVATATAQTIRIGAMEASVPAPQWIPSGRLPLPAVLVPGEIYTLQMEFPADQYLVGVNQLGGGPLVGDLSIQQGSGSPWTPAPFGVLSFRLIGAEGVAGPSLPVPCTITAAYDAGDLVVTRTAGVRFEPGARVAQLLPAGELNPLGSIALLLDAQPATVTMRAGLMLGSSSGPEENFTYPLMNVTVNPSLRSPGLDDGLHGIDLPRPLVLRTVTPSATLVGTRDLIVVLNGTGVRHVLGAPRSVTITASPSMLLGEGAGGVWGPVEAGGGATLTALARYCGIHDDDGDHGADLAVCAQILRVTDPMPGEPLPVSIPAPPDYLMRFVPPVTVTPEWLEFAVARVSSGTSAPILQVFDALLSPDPPGAGTPPMTQVTMSLPSPTHTVEPEWLGSSRFADGLVLEAGHPYWIEFAGGGGGGGGSGGWLLGTCAVTATAMPPGSEFFTRESPSLPWVPDPSRVLSFRLIGVPIEGGTTDVPWAIRPHEGFALALGPNPSRGGIHFAWSGGSGRARLELTDVAGRVVRRIRDAGPAANGRWRWDGLDDHGRSAPAGVYFARVSCDGGLVATRRVVRVR